MLKPRITFRYQPILITLMIFILFFGTFAVAEEVDDETCLNCHEGLQASLNVTAHNSSSKEVSCVGCHGSADAHIEDPSLDNIINPKSLSTLKADALCSGCHQAHRELDNFGADSHQGSDVNCFSCHQIHGGNPSLLLDREASFCLSCHIETKADFSRRSSHPVNGGFMNCLSCHQFSKATDNDMAYDNGRLCRDCHPNQAGPFMYEHEAANAYSIEGGGCIECHNPHGSENDRLLKQPGNNLCNSCHFVPGHQIAHPNRNYDELQCVECHTGSHGSHDSNILLDPNLPSKFADNCYQSGCHSLNQ